MCVNVVAFFSQVSGFDARITLEEFWSSVGFWIVVVGLVGDIAVLVVPRHRDRLEKLLSAFFTIVIIIGVAVEHRADKAISVQVAQLQEAATPRTVSREQAAKIADFLREFAGQHVQLKLYDEGYETKTFAGQVSETLAKAGIVVDTTYMMAGTGSGFGICVHDLESVPPLASTLALAFRSAGFTTGLQNCPNDVGSGQFFIGIGAKPQTQPN